MLTYFWFQWNVTIVQSCAPLCDPMDCSRPGSSVWNSLGKKTSGLPFSFSNFWSQRLYKLNPSVSEKETLSQDVSPAEHTDDVT